VSNAFYESIRLLRFIAVMVRLHLMVQDLALAFERKSLGETLRGTALLAPQGHSRSPQAVSAHARDEPLAALDRRRAIASAAARGGRRAGWSPDMGTAPGGTVVLLSLTSHSSIASPASRTSGTSVFFRTRKKRFLRSPPLAVASRSLTPRRADAGSFRQKGEPT